MNRANEIRRRAYLLTLLPSHVLASVLLAILPLLLLFNGETVAGRLVGLGALFLLLSCLALWLMMSSNRKLRLLPLPLFTAGLICIAICYAISPNGDVPPGNFSSHYGDRAKFSRISLANLVPEIDQLKLGSYLFSLIDPRLGAEQGSHLRHLVLDVYGEMDRDENFRDAGSVLGMCYEDILLGRRDKLHFYEYVPRHLGRKSYPVMIFLHGSLGNFKGYMWVLKELADSSGIAIIAPTYGCGNWYLDRGCSVLNATYAYCRANSELDANRIILAGLSNGGTGVTRAVRDHGQRYMGVILLSAVLEQSIISSPSFASNAVKSRFLIIHGEDDNRIPVECARRCEAVLKQDGLTVKSRYYQGEDHFLFFSRRTEIVKDMAEWIGQL